MAKAITTFLLADDDEDFCFLLGRFFQSSPTQRLYAVSDGLQAKKYLEGIGEYADREKYPLPDVFLTDLKLGGCSGFELLEWLTAHGSQDLRMIRTIILTGSSDSEHMDRAYKSGAHAYLVKSGNWEKLQGEIVALANQ